MPGDEKHDSDQIEEQLLKKFDEKIGKMTERFFDKMIDSVDVIVERKTAHLGQVVSSVKGAAMNFASNLDSIERGESVSQAPPQQAVPSWAAPMQKQAPPQPERRPAPSAPPPEAAVPYVEPEAPPIPKKKLPKRSTSEGTQEHQKFIRTNKPHLENETLLKLTDLSKRYDNGVLAVDNMNLEIHKGEIFCMLGANGAGKTSTLMLILSFSEPTAGTVDICGINVHKDPLKAKTHMAYVSENVMLYGNFTAMQNIDFFTRLAGKKATSDEYHKVLRRVGLSEEAHNRKVKSFSKGMRQRSGIAIAIMKDADVILLDEPTSGLDPKGGMEFLKLLDELRSENRGVLMTTHDIFRAKEIADRVGIMSAGSLVRVLDREEIEEADLAELYLQYISEDVTHGKIA